MEYIISALWFSLECVAFFLFASAFLPYRYNRRRTILTAFGICVLLLLSQSLPLPALALRLCALVFGLCLIVFLFQGRLAQRLFIGLLDYILIAAMDAIVLFGAPTVLRISLDELVWKKGMYTVLVTAGKILSVSKAPSAAPAMDAACRHLPADKSFDADGDVPALQRRAGAYAAGGVVLPLSRHCQCGNRLCRLAPGTRYRDHTAESYPDAADGTANCRYSCAGQGVPAAAANDARFSESSVYHLRSSFPELL